MLPSKPTAHSHENVSPLIEQIPLFLQGRESHGVRGNSKDRKIIGLL